MPIATIATEQRLLIAFTPSQSCPDDGPKTNNEGRKLPIELAALVCELGVPRPTRIGHLPVAQPSLRASSVQLRRGRLLLTALHA
jgi:hypothetical protein